MMNENEQRALAIPERPRYEGFEFSVSQQKAISDLAISYLKKNNIDFNKDTLRRAFGVLGVDSLGRGLAASGRDVLKPTENVRPFIRVGIEERTRIQETATRVYQEFKNELMMTDSAYVGPMALPKDVFLRSERELKSFFTSPNIPNSEKISYLYGSRQEMLPKIAELAISTLPKEEYPRASIEEFKNPSDQAKIVRNMITSIVFRGKSFPAISIEDLSQFANTQDFDTKFDEELTSEISKAIASSSQLPEEDVNDYIRGLYAQVREAFVKYAETGHSKVRQEDKEATRDQLFRGFNNTLLLLHPALEEQPFITSISRLKKEEGEYSLWSQEFSIAFGTARIPTPDGLYRAIRLAEAEGFSPERFTEGVSAWHSLRRGQEQEVVRVDRLKSEIHLQEQELERIQNKDEQLPDRADWMMRTFRHEESELFASVGAGTRRNQRIIDQAKESRDRTSDYINRLKNENEGELPQEAPIPKSILAIQTVYQTGRAERIAASAAGRIERARETLWQDFLTQHNTDFEAKVRSIESLSTDEIKTLIDETQSEIEKIEKDRSQTISLGEDLGPAQALEYIDMLIGQDKSRLLNRSPSKRARELEILREIINRKERLGIYEWNKGVPKEFYLFSLKNRKQALERITLERIKIENPPEVEDVVSTWSKEKIEEWAKKAAVSTLPEDISVAFIEEHIEELDTWWKKYTSGMARNISWPRYVPTREDFINWVNEERERKNKRIEEWPKRDQRSTWTHTRQNLENNINLLSELLTILDNPLFPLQEAEGLETRGFWGLFGKRLQLANAIVNKESVDTNFRIKTEDYNSSKREVYKEFLERKKLGLERELLNLSTNPSLRRFLERMRGLNLALEESSI